VVGARDAQRRFRFRLRPRLRVRDAAAASASVRGDIASLATIGVTLPFTIAVEGQLARTRLFINLIQEPANPTTSTRASFAWNSSSPSTAWCKLDGELRVVLVADNVIEPGRR
jgi:hypothetical protein